LAGLSAAISITEAGHHVTVLESAKELGEVSSRWTVQAPEFVQLIPFQ
jgi:uncharacterized protein with NAD-binding domain and iron-sulfur cluster